MATYYGDVTTGVVSGTIFGFTGGAGRPSTGQLWPRGTKN